MAVAEILYDQGLVRFAGIGNVSAVTIQGEVARNMVSHNGIVGHQMRRVTEFQYPWLNSSMLIMHSDGMTTHWNLTDYPGLTTRDPGVIAAVLYRDFERGRDDVTVMVVKQSGRSSVASSVE